jgi:glycosyltransferase involved in cell wall biosynthesis
MRIVIVEPYLTGSHAAWANEYAHYSRHDVSILGLPGRHWKWRMHGGAVTLAGQFVERDFRPDLVIASDMLDLTTFLALARDRLAEVKIAVYFHENQISYPWPQGDPDPAGERDVHYGFINFTSALAADAVCFNSEYHRTSFLGGLVPFLQAFPDYSGVDAVEVVRAKSHVLPLAVDLGRFDEYRRKVEHDLARPQHGRRPLILWNHRWEYDKNPEDFFRALFALKDQGLEFDVAVLGESFREKPPVFAEAVSRLGERIVQFGFVEDFGTYASWLWEADLIPVTSVHDFFGASIVQAIYCNTYPLLPRRLAYPEHIPEEHQGDHIYEDLTDLVTRLRHRIDNIGETRRIETQAFVRQYDWETMAPEYDRFFESCVCP